MFSTSYWSQKVQKRPSCQFFTTREEITWRKRPYSHGFREFWCKKLHFSIFFKLSQMLSNDVKTAPRCFSTLKATSKTSGQILRSFEKFFIYQGFQKLLKAFSIWNPWPSWYDRGVAVTRFQNWFFSQISFQTKSARQKVALWSEEASPSISKS